MELLFLFSLLTLVSAHRPRENIFNILDFGAVGDGVTLNTAAFEKAVASVAAAGEGEIYIPMGKFLTAPFNITSHCTLFLDTGAVILGSTNMTLWPIIPPLPSYGRGRDHPGPRFTSLIHGENLTDIEVTGNNGTVDGQGAVWWEAHNNGSEVYTRGHLIEFMYCEQIVITNITCQNSPFWTIHPYSSNNVYAANLTILAPNYSPNTDGFDPDSTSNVVFENSYISNGDDGVAIKSGWDCYGVQYGVPTTNILIRNITVISPQAAGVTIGSEMSGGVRNVTVQNCTFYNVAYGLRVKANEGRSGYVRDFFQSNVYIQRAQTFLMVNDFYGDPNPQCSGPAGPPPVIDNIQFINISGTTAAQIGDFEGLTDSPITNVVLQSVHFTDAAKYTCSQVSGTSKDVSPAPCSQLQN